MKMIQLFYEAYYTVGSGLVLFLTTKSASFTENGFTAVYVGLVFLFSALFSVGFLRTAKKIKKRWFPKHHAD